jgi:hypothetical protein
VKEHPDETPIQLKAPYRLDLGKNNELLVYLKDNRVLAVGDDCTVLYRNHADYLAERRQDDCSVLVYDE